MKKILLLLFATSLFIACSDNGNEEEEQGYLTSVTNAKSGIVGTWRVNSGSSYDSYKQDGTFCWGTSLDDLTMGCRKYDILFKNNSYVIKVYDPDNVDDYTESLITVLNEEQLIYTTQYANPSNNKEYKFTRVK